MFCGLSFIMLTDGQELRDLKSESLREGSTVLIVMSLFIVFPYLEQISALSDLDDIIVTKPAF